jgi:3-oxoacyl-[acyl-carrier-protein] synthase-3
MKRQPRSSPRPRSSKSLPRRTVSIIGTGSYVPEKILTNEDLSRIVDTSDEWITTRTGIKERRIAAKDENTSDMAAKAALNAIEQAKISAADIDLILVATATPDMLFPATACFVQKKIGAKNAACLDVSAACAGFIFGLEIGQQFITSHTYDTVLVIGAEKLTSITNWTDRNTCVLFGDGAGAAILRHRGSEHGVISTHIGSDGEFTDILFMPGGGSRCPITRDNVDLNLATIHMTGKEVYKQAVIAMLSAAQKALEQAGLSIHDIACVIPHQANLRIIEGIADRLRIPLEKFYVNLDRYGNTSAAAVAIALDEANRTGRIKPGDYVLMVVFGGGLTWASTVIEW